MLGVLQLQLHLASLPLSSCVGRKCWVAGEHCMNNFSTELEWTHRVDGSYGKSADSRCFCNTKFINTEGFVEQQ